MKRRISFLLMLCMILSFCAFGAAPAMAEDWKLPEGTPMYEPYVMDLDFGSLTILGVGFAKTVQSGLSSVFSKEISPRFFSAKDGFALFAVKGILHNSSKSNVDLGPIQPKISYGPGNKWVGLFGYPIVPLGAPESSVLAPGQDVEIIYACEVPNAMYFGGMDLLMEVGNSSLGFKREDLKSFISIGFNDADGAPAGDITLMADAEQLNPAPLETDDLDMDYLTFSDPKLVPAEDKSGMYRLDFVFSFLYPEKSGENYPTYVNINYSLLDADQVAVKSTYLQANNLFYGSKVRASACQFFESSHSLITPEEYPQIKYVRFTGCMISIPQEGSKVTVVERTFKSTEVFPLFNPGTAVSGQTGTANALTAQNSVVMPESSTENEYFTFNALCVDDSYRDEDNSPLRAVYLFYSLTAVDENLEIDSKNTALIINGKNEYKSSNSLEARKWIRRFYNSSYLEDVYIGSSLDVMASFKIPEGDLAPGRTITIRDSQIPGIESITLFTDDMQHFNGIEEIAASADPDGYAEMVEMRKDADAALTQRVRDAVTNRYYTCYVNNLWYRVEFHPGDEFEVITDFSKLVENKGTYTVKNGYIFCTNGLGYIIEIPYHFQDDGLIWLDTDEAFEVN